MSEQESKPATELPTPTIPADLQGLFGSAQALATCYTVLNRGTFAPQMFQSVVDCSGFLLKAYEDAVEKCLAHPNAELIPQLKDAKEEIEKKKAAQNGEA